MTGVIEVYDFNEAGEDGGDLMGFYAKGHHDRHDFAEACNHYTGADPVYDVRHVRADTVHHAWWRCVPIAGASGYYRFDAAEPKTRGAFAVTLWDGLQRRAVRSASDTLRHWRQGRNNGLAEGVNWCLQTLDVSFPEASEFLLAAFRNKRDDIEGASP